MTRARTPHASRARAAGLTLIELMVGLAVGLFVVGVAIAIFISTRTLHGVNSASSRMSENGRLAMDVLQSDIRNANYSGCKPLLNDPPVNLLNAGSGVFMTTAGLGGHHGTDTGFVPALVPPLAALAAAAAPLPSSDVLSVRVPADMEGLGVVAPMTSASAAPQVAASAPGNSLSQGDIVLIASCKAAAIFQVTEADPAATGMLNHAINGGFDPGNFDADLKQRFRSDATVYKLQTRHYYVAPSALRPGTNSLWRMVSPTSGPPEEVASGVDRLVVTYGVDDGAGVGTQNVERYTDASGVTAWNKVISVRLQLLVATAKDGVTRAPQTVDFAASSVAATDRRLRTVLSDVVTVRNSAP